MVSRDQNEAVAGLLRQSLARDAAASNCPEPEMLAAYFEHSLDEGEASQFDRHLSTCSRCRQQLASMARAEIPNVKSKTFWLLDWRLLSAAVAAMVILTVWFVRRPERLEPVAQNQDVAAPAVAREADKAATPSGPTGTVKQTHPNLMGGATASSPRSSAAERMENKKVPKDALAGFGSGQSLAKQAPKAAQVQTQSGDTATAAGSGGGIGGGNTGRPSATARHAGSVQQQQQQIPAASQMVLVEPATPPQAPAQPQASPTRSKAANKSVNAPAAPVTAQSETVQVTSGAQPAAARNSKEGSQPEAGVYLANRDDASLQMLEERSLDKVIDTPVPSVKWRITAAGFVERSEDGGKTWTGQEPDPQAHLIAGSAPTDKVCWLVGKEGIVLVTKDATNWKKVPPPVEGDITSVSAESAASATVTTSDGRRFATKNEGKKWKPVD